ncbi:MAG: glycosyl hydrolase [Oscillospiraceae bacterium]
MNNKTKKIVALVSAISMLSVATVSNVFAVDTTNDDLEYTEFPFVRECEDPEIANGNETWTSIYETQIPNYSGDGFVYLTGNSIKFELTVPEDAMYEIKVRYAQMLSEDGRMQTICVNGSDYMVNFPYSDTWQDISFGMFRLKAGVNTIEIKPQYGYASYDTITVDKAVFPSLDVEPTLADKEATPETQSLMNYLCDVYGNGIISGQQEIYGGGNDGDYELEFDFIENLTGELPAIRGFDFMNYNPLYGWDDNTTERVIEWVNERNGIATGCWHINVPKDFANYELGDAVDWKECTYKPDETDFDTNNAIIEGTKEYDYFMLAIEDLAEQLLRLQEANVPIILRPLHEAEGNSNTDGSGSWFWWGKGGAETYKELWKLLYTTLTEDYGLHNIIWEYNSYDYTTSAQWYPGDDYVDIVGFDKYNTVYNRHDGLSSGPNVDAISSTFYSLVNLTNGNKLVSMPENDTIPTIENMEVEEARWLYFCPWYGEHILDSSKNDPETVKEIYQDDYCINLADLPKNLYSGYTSSGDSDGDKDTEQTTTTTVVTTTDPTETSSESMITSTPQTIPTYIYGVITEISDDTITIVDDEEKEYVCPIDEDTSIEDNIEVGSNVKVFAFVNFFDYTEVYSTMTISLYINEFDIPVVLTGTVTEVDTENDTITVDFTTFTQTIQGYSSYAKVGDTVTASNMSDVIDDEWFETAIISIKSTDETTTVTNTSGETLLGDANCDGSIKSNDLISIRRQLLHIEDLSVQGNLNADVNKDGEVRSNDLLQIRKYLLHLISSFDEEPTPVVTETSIETTATSIND